MQNPKLRIAFFVSFYIFSLILFLFLVYMRTSAFLVCYCLIMFLLSMCVFCIVDPLKAGFIQKSIPNLLFQPQFRKSLEHVSKFICGAVTFNIRMPRCQVFMAIV